MEELTQRLSETQPLVFKQLKKSYEHGSLAHAYLFEGTAGTGKREMALWLAQLIFCQSAEAAKPCGQCNNCQRIIEGEHPDVQEIIPDGQTIKVEQIRQLKSEFSRSGVETKKKIFIIQNAEKMTVNAANSLLKFLEEPDGQVLALLLTESQFRILPTIQSRCQVLHFQALAPKAFVETLVAKGISRSQSEALSGVTRSLTKAVEISQEEWFNDARERMSEWFQHLLKKDRRAFVFVQTKLLPLFKEKKQQELGLDLLLAYYEKQLQKQVTDLAGTKVNLEITEAMELILQAKRKLEANVAFQNVCEQLALKIIA